MKQGIVFLFLFAISESAFSEKCYRTFIQEPTPYLGNGGEIIVLGDGSFWKEVSYQYLYLYAYNPSVLVCSDGLMILDGHEFALVSVK